MGNGMSVDDFFSKFKSVEEPSLESKMAFEKAITEDESKQRYALAFTNLFTDIYPRGQIKDIGCFMSGQDERKIKTCFGDDESSHKDRIVAYLEEHWQGEAPFASAYGLLNELEQATGGPWRIDRIHNMTLNVTARQVNTQTTFQCPTSYGHYAVYQLGKA